MGRIWTATSDNPVPICTLQNKTKIRSLWKVREYFNKNHHETQKCRRARGLSSQPVSTGRRREREQKKCRRPRRCWEPCWVWAPRCTPTPSASSPTCGVPSLISSLETLTSFNSLSFLSIRLNEGHDSFGLIWLLQIHGSTFLEWVWAWSSWTSWWNGTTSSKRISTRCSRRSRPPTSADTLVNSHSFFVWFDLSILIQNRFLQSIPKLKDHNCLLRYYQNLDRIPWIIPLSWKNLLIFLILQNVQFFCTTLTS